MQCRTLPRRGRPGGTLQPEPQAAPGCAAAHPEVFVQARRTAVFQRSGGSVRSPAFFSRACLQELEHACMDVMPSSLARAGRSPRNAMRLPCTLFRHAGAGAQRTECRGTRRHVLLLRPVQKGRRLILPSCLFCQIVRRFCAGAHAVQQTCSAFPFSRQRLELRQARRQSPPCLPAFSRRSSCIPSYDSFPCI